MIDPTMYTMAWRLGHQGERERREAAHDLGELAARLRRSRRRWVRRRAARADHQAAGDRPPAENDADSSHRVTGGRATG